MLGIEKEVSEFCMASTGWNSIERALNYKYEEDENQLLLHQFI